MRAQTVRWRRKNTIWSTSDEHKNCLSVISPSVCEPVVLLHRPSVYLTLPSNPFVLLYLASFCSTLPIHSPDYTTDTKYHTNKSNSNILPYGIWIMNFPEGMQSIMGYCSKQERETERKSRKRQQQEGEIKAEKEQVKTPYCAAHGSQISLIHY